MDLINDPLISALLDSPVPMLVLQTNEPDFTIVTYNEAYEDATHTRRRDVAGLTLWEAFHPEKAGGYGPTLLLEAFHEAIFTGRTIQMKPLHYNIPSVLPHIGELSWWNIKIRPVSYNGFVKYLLLTTYNITDKILHEDAIEEAIMKELTMAENLASTNVKLNIVVEKLAESNDELMQTKEELEDLNKTLEQHVFDRTKKLFESEARQRKLMDHAPVAIAVLKGPHHVIETANRKIIEYWGKNSSVVGKPLASAIPELKGQPFIEILDQVRETGVAYINSELRAYLNFNGSYQSRYYDMIYQPIQHTPGITDSIFIVAFDITDHVLARKELEQSESMLRLAVTAARIGTWTFDTNERVLVYNSTYTEIIGWKNEEKLSYDQAVGQVSDEFREKVVTIIDEAIAVGSEFDVTYSLRRFNDDKLIWLRATGKVTSDDSGVHNLFSGIIREVDHPGSTS